MKKEKTDKKDKLDKQARSNVRLARLYTVIFVLIIVLFIVIHFFNKYVKTPEKIYKQIGNSTPVSVSMKDAYIIREYSIVLFRAYLKERNFDLAYEMCTTDFKNTYSLEEFTALYKDIDLETFEMKEIKAYSDYCFEATMVYKDKTNSNYSGDENTNLLKETKYLLYVNRYNTQSISISPYGYLYSILDKSFSNNGVEVNVNRIDVYIDKIILDCNLKNVDWFSDKYIKAIKLGLGENMSKYISIKQNLAKEEVMSINQTIENSNSFMPDNIQIVHSKDQQEFLTDLYYFETK